ncbi:MAG: methyltransferase domain-containing protein [Pseudonocardiaceae bacterium]
MDERLADELIASGDLTSEWRPSFLAVPRVQFIPDTIWHEVDGVMRPVRRSDALDRWRELACSEDSVVTQVDDGRPVGPGDGGDLPTSSASQPNVVALMLTHLDVQGGERVLEIGTGTGWNAALLAHRLGAGRVTTIEVDPEVAAHARTALQNVGLGAVTVITGDGSRGHPPQAPYDRVIATVGSKYLPYAWVAQTRPGGRIVAPSWALTYHGLLLALTVNEDGTAAGHFVDDVSFMMLREQRAHRSRQVITDADDYEQATITETDLHPAEVASASYALGAVIAIGTRVPDCRSDYFPPTDPGSKDGTLRLVDHRSGSWARLRYDHDGGPPYTVRQFGPRRLWDEVEAAHQWWVDAGRPDADRWRFTVTPDGQRIELE